MNNIKIKDIAIVTEPNETILTMAIDAANNVLQKTGISPTELDLVVFTTQTCTPTLSANAFHLRAAIGAGLKTRFYDLNANSAGMVTAIEQISRYMLSNLSVNKVLIVGSDMRSEIPNENEPVSTAVFADGASAIILERTVEDAGFIDANYLINSEATLYDSDLVLDGAFELLDELFKRNNIEPNDAKYCFSQPTGTDTYIQGIQSRFNINDENIMFTDDKYRYTGTSSPIFALHEGIEEGRIQHGDYVVFSAVDHGLQLISTLVKY